MWLTIIKQRALNVYTYIVNDIINFVNSLHPTKMQVAHSLIAKSRMWKEERKTELFIHDQLQ